MAEFSKNFGVVWIFCPIREDIFAFKVNFTPVFCLLSSAVEHLIVEKGCHLYHSI